MKPFFVSFFLDLIGSFQDHIQFCRKIWQMKLDKNKKRSIKYPNGTQIISINGIKRVSLKREKENDAEDKHDEWRQLMKLKSDRTIDQNGDESTELTLWIWQSSQIRAAFKFASTSRIFLPFPYGFLCFFFCKTIL